jgi:prepilin-type processing-associated H-X9-DG protein
MASQMADPAYTAIAPYARNPAVWKCPADRSTFFYQSGKKWPTSKSYCINGAVGTTPGKLTPVDGLWLNGMGNQPNTAASGPWRTYGKLADMTRPSPAEIYLEVDTAQQPGPPRSQFFIPMAQAMWSFTYPGQYHSFASMFSFADGHSEMRKWRDARTRALAGVTDSLLWDIQPDNQDILWVQARTSALR